MRFLSVLKRLLIELHRTLAVLIALFTLTACDHPWWYLDNIKIIATFRPDGSCSFSVGGETLSDNQYKQFNALESGSGFTTENFDGYSLRCDSQEAMVNKQPTLIVLMAVPKSNVPSRGNYEISAKEGMATQIKTTVGVLRYEKYSRPNLTNGITGAELMGLEGSFVIDQVIPNRPFLIGGHLSAVARRKARGI